MAETLFVANFDESVDGSELESWFSRYGTVNRARVWIDLKTGDSRGFGFVEMENDHEAELAIEEMDGRLWAGRRLRVGFARPRTDPRS